MKKRLISLILMALMALSCALAEETGNVPLMAYYECFAVPLGENALSRFRTNGATRRRMLRTCRR